MVIKKRNSPVYKGYAYVLSILLPLLSIMYWNKGDNDIALIILASSCSMVFVILLLNIESKQMLVFDEFGIQGVFGKKTKMQYSWSELECVYYQNASLSKKEKKKLERNLIPINPRVIIYRKISDTRKKNIATIFLLEDNEVLFGKYIFQKEEFLSKMQEWDISLNTLN